MIPNLRVALLVPGCVLSLAIAVSACGGESETTASPETPAAVETPTDTPYVTSSDQAVALVFEQLSASKLLTRSDPSQVTADKITYGEAIERANGFLVIFESARPRNYPPCPQGASCPEPGEPADAVGYFVTVRADFSDYGDVTKPRQEGIEVCWIGESGRAFYAYKPTVNGVPER